jgi:hypothetical protein
MVDEPTTESVVSGPTIANRASLSSVLDASTATVGIKRITMPVDWTPAWLTFQISTDGTNFSDLYFADGKLVIVTVVPGATIPVKGDVWRAGYFKFRSGPPNAPVIQLAARTFTCFVE